MNNTVISNSNSKNSVLPTINKIVKKKIVRPILYTITVPLTSTTGAVIGGVFTLIDNPIRGTYGLITGICHLRMHTEFTSNGPIFFDRYEEPHIVGAWHKKWGIKDGAKTIVRTPISSIENGYILGKKFSEKNINFIRNLTH